MAKANKGKVLYFPESYTETQRESILDLLAEQRLDEILTDPEEYMYKDGTFYMNEKVYDSYVKAIRVLDKLQKQKKIKASYSDPRFPYADHIIRIKWLTHKKEDLEIDAREVIKILNPLIEEHKTGTGDTTITMKDDGEWILYVALYRPIE